MQVFSGENLQFFDRYVKNRLLSQKYQSKFSYFKQYFEIDFTFKRRKDIIRKRIFRFG